MEGNLDYKALAKEIDEQDVRRIERIAKMKALRFSSGDLDWEDLFQEGCLGYLDAKTRYDPSLGFTLGTYALQRARGAMTDYLRGADPVPRSVRSLARKVQEAIKDYSSEYGQEPTLEQLSVILELPRKKIETALLGWQQIELGLEEMKEGVQEVELLAAPTPTPEETSSRTEHLLTLAARVDWILQSLGGDKEYVLRAIFFQGKTYRLIGAELGVTDSRIAQIYALAIKAFAIRYEAMEAVDTRDPSTVPVTRPLPESKFESELDDTARALDELLGAMDFPTSDDTS